MLDDWGVAVLNCLGTRIGVSTTPLVRIVSSDALSWAFRYSSSAIRTTCDSLMPNRSPKAIRSSFSSIEHFALITSSFCTAMILNRATNVPHYKIFDFFL